MPGGEQGPVWRTQRSRFLPVLSPPTRAACALPAGWFPVVFEPRLWLLETLSQALPLSRGSKENAEFSSAPCPGASAETQQVWVCLGCLRETRLPPERLGPDVCAILQLSAPLKEQYAKEHGLDFQRLLDASDYKETYRQDMIRWGEEKRNTDPGFFCRIVVEGVTQPVWVVSDTRRLSDVEWFQAVYGAAVQVVRVVAAEETRKKRNWVFVAGVDDAESECGLDQGVTFDWIITNDGDELSLDSQLEELLGFICSKL